MDIFLYVCVFFISYTLFSYLRQIADNTNPNGNKPVEGDWVSRWQKARKRALLEKKASEEQLANRSPEEKRKHRLIVAGCSLICFPPPLAVIIWVCYLLEYPALAYLIYLVIIVCLIYTMYLLRRES